MPIEPIDPRNEAPIRKILETTRDQYKKYAGRCIRFSSAKTERLSRNPAIPSPIQVSADLIEHSQRLAPATFNLYRAALIWHFDDVCSDKPVDTAFKAECIAATNLLNASKSMASEAAVVKQKKVARRRRRITIDDKQLLDAELLGELTSKRTELGRQTKIFFTAALATGLRPSEWHEARWLDSTMKALSVVNSKSKAEYRDIVNSSEILAGSPAYEVVSEPAKIRRKVPIQDADISAVKAQIEQIEGLTKEEFTAFLKACENKLYRASNKHPELRGRCSLYTARGQAVANLKAIFSTEEVKDIVGHSRSSRTTDLNYGKAKHAHARSGTQQYENESFARFQAGPKLRDRERQRGG